MSSPNEVRRQNRELAEKIDEEARANPQSPYAGKFVAIIKGQVAAVADDIDTLMGLVQHLEPKPPELYCLEAGGDRTKPVRV